MINWDAKIPEVCSYGTAADYCQLPDATQRCSGVAPLDSLPAAWWNAMWHDNNAAFNCSRALVNNIGQELCNIITCRGGTLNQNCNSQLYNTIFAAGTANALGMVKSSTTAGKVSIDSNGIMSLNCYGSAALQTTAQNLTGAINELKGAIDNFVGVVYSDAAPLVDGTAAAGTCATAARGDHVHPIGCCICTGNSYVKSQTMFDDTGQNVLYACGVQACNLLCTVGANGSNVLCACHCLGFNNMRASGACGFNQLCVTGVCGRNQLSACGNFACNILLTSGYCGYNQLRATGCWGYNQLFVEGCCGYNQIYACGECGSNQVYASGCYSYNLLCAMGNGQVANCIETAKCSSDALVAGEEYLTEMRTRTGTDLTPTCTIIQQFRNPAYNQMLLGALDAGAATATTEPTGIEMAAMACYVCCSRSPFIRLHTGGNNYSGGSSLALCTRSPSVAASSDQACTYGYLQHDGNLVNFNIGRRYNGSISLAANVFNIDLDSYASDYGTRSCLYTPKMSVNHGIVDIVPLLEKFSIRYCCRGGSAGSYSHEVFVNTNGCGASRYGCGGCAACKVIFSPTLGLVQNYADYSWHSLGYCVTSACSSTHDVAEWGLMAYKD